MSIRDRAQNAFEMSPRLITTLYGNPNVGKTILGVRTTEPGKSCVILTAEKGHMALRDFPELARITEVITCTGINDVFEVFNEIYNGWTINDLPVGHLMLDTFGGLQQLFIDEHMDVQNKDYALKVNRNHPLVPVLQDYNLSLRHWTDLMARMAKQNIVDVTICAHVQAPDMSKKVSIPRPVMTDKVFHVINGMSNIIGMMYNDKGYRVVAVRSPKNEFSAKSQLATLNDLMTDDQYVEGLNKWRASLATT